MSLLSTALEQGLTPDIIDDTNPDDIYLGYFKYDKIAKPNHCLIKRVTKIAGITTVQFPVGKFDHLFSWADRATLEYRYRDFPPEFDPTHLGYLYNLFTLLDARGIAPAGFHLPSFAEMGVWGNGGANPGENYRLLTSKYDPLGWSREPRDMEATNLTGFSAVPAGWRQYGQFSGTDFNGLTAWASFWCTYDGGATGRYGQINSNNYMELSVSSIPKKMGLSVRFIKNTNVFDPEEVVLDVDGNVYGTCRPNASQVWTDKNFKGMSFNNLDPIPTVTDQAEWTALITAGKCAPLNIEEHV